jgi:hypothetical protein
MQQLQAELDDSGTYKATKDDLTVKMNAIAVQLIELDGTRVVMDRATVDHIHALLKDLNNMVPSSRWPDIDNRLETALSRLDVEVG